MVKVIIRKKPSTNNTNIIDIKSEKTLDLLNNYKKYDLTPVIRRTEYTFERIYNENSTNFEIYENELKKNIYNNFSLFVYGQTNSGKTHTTLGTENVKGVIQFAVEDLLNDPNNNIEISSFQIYDNNLLDLSNKKTLNMYEVNGNMILKGLIMNKIKNIDDFYYLLNIINKNRISNSNQINKSSSRSHAFFYIYNTNFENKKNLIKIIDLAGNEKSIFGVNQNRRETNFINSSLLAFKECILAMNNRNNYIPFRRSKLTMLLRDCFRINYNCSIISTLNSEEDKYNDTLDTLNYSISLKKNGIIPKKFFEEIINKYSYIDTIPIHNDCNNLQQKKISNIKISSKPKINNIIKNTKPKVSKPNNFIKYTKINKPTNNIKINKPISNLNKIETNTRTKLESDIDKEINNMKNKNKYKKKISNNILNNSMFVILKDNNNNMNEINLATNKLKNINEELFKQIVKTNSIFENEDINKPDKVIKIYGDLLKMVHNYYESLDEIRPLIFKK